MGIRVRDTPRSSDDRVLLWIDMRRRGVSTSDIAREFHTTQQLVSQSTMNVLTADLTESGEPQEKVAKHYWRSTR